MHKRGHQRDYIRESESVKMQRMQPTSASASEQPVQGTRLPDRPRDRPGVRIPPPLIYAVAFLIGLALQVRFPFPFLPPALGLGVGAVFAACGAILIAASIPTMVRRGGTLNTNAASQRLVTSGVYRLSRNPMYLALVLLHAALACVLGITWAVLLLPLPILYTRYLAVAREERFLEAAFGDDYRRYKARVHRWL